MKSSKSTKQTKMDILPPLSWQFSPYTIVKTAEVFSFLVLPRIRVVCFSLVSAYLIIQLMKHRQSI